MGIVAAVIMCLKKSTDFAGRARRLEFWSFVVFWLIAAVLASLAYKLPPAPAMTLAWWLEALVAAPVLLVPILLLLPLAAVAVRRLHDIGLSGWWLLSASLPVPVLDVLVVGAQVVCFARPGTAGDNRYGPDPKQI